MDLIRFFPLVLLMASLGTMVHCGGGVTSNSDPKKITDSGDDNTDNTEEGSEELGDTKSGEETDGGQGDGDGDETTSPTIVLGRNTSEVIIPGSTYHLQNQDLTAVMEFPSGTGPFPGAIIMHGSGGLFVEPDKQGGSPGDPCTETIESKFNDLKNLFLAEGVAVIMPASFFSRDNRFCEDNDPDYLAFAPSDMDDRAEERIAGRTYDLLATVTYFCAFTEVDCNKLLFTGTSNGGSIIFHYIHQYLVESFEAWFVKDAAELAEVPYVAIPEDRPMPQVVTAISPGCGIHGAINFSSDPSDDIEDLYYPAVPLFLEIGTADTVPEECTIQVLGYDGRRELQALEVKLRLGITNLDFNYNISLHLGAGHDLLGDGTVGPQIETKLVNQVNTYLKP